VKAVPFDGPKDGSEVANTKRPPAESN
jgi:hypothetical protein